MYLVSIGRNKATPEIFWDNSERKTQNLSRAERCLDQTPGFPMTDQKEAWSDAQTQKAALPSSLLEASQQHLRIQEMLRQHILDLPKVSQQALRMQDMLRQLIFAAET